MASIFRDQLLRGKTAFVTGGGSGIGQRMAERFAQHGAKLMIIGRKQEKRKCQRPKPANPPKGPDHRSQYNDK